eukprot:5474719-Pyramimonas_sp.AAC.1
MVNNPTKTLQDLYALCDTLLQTEHGSGYNTKSCPVDSNEHLSTGGPKKPAWIVVNNKSNKRKANGNGNGKNNASASGYKKSGTGAKKPAAQQPDDRDMSITCSRCKNHGHNVDICNARGKVDQYEDYPNTKTKIDVNNINVTEQSSITVEPASKLNFSKALKGENTQGLNTQQKIQVEEVQVDYIQCCPPLTKMQSGLASALENMHAGAAQYQRACS